MPTILSIQSSVAYGHVGNSAATFPLMRMGLQVWPVFTVHFSNHTGYPSWRGPMLTAADIGEVVRGIDERGVLGRVDAVLSGYQGGEDIAAAILDAVALVRRRNPAALYCCDPVLGDTDRGLYVRPAIPGLMHDAVLPVADIATPNQFELSTLTGSATDTLDGLLAGARRLLALGPRTVLVTSAVHDRTPPDAIDMVAVTADGAWLVRTPRLAQTFTGAGDLTAATFLAQMLLGHALEEALGRTAAVVYGVLARTAAAGGSELALVEAQDELVAPGRTFRAEPVEI